MFSFRTNSIFVQEDLALKNGRIAVFCNQTAWHPESGEYLFETFGKRGNLKKLITPGTGFFGENPERDGLHEGLLKTLDCEITGLYDQSGHPCRNLYDGIDAIVMEMQDTGTRYSTVTEDLCRLLSDMAERNIDIPIYIIDRINPSGRQVEGTSLKPVFAPVPAMEGMLHKHGLTIGETAAMIQSETGARFPLHVISCMAPGTERYLMPWSIPPQNDFAGLFSANFHSGQHLLKGTNLSWGEGTARPFEQFGAPYLKVKPINCDTPEAGALKDGLDFAGTYLRPTSFIPGYGKYAGKKCYGYQIILSPDTQYHSLAHSLQIIRYMNLNVPKFAFSGPSGNGDTSEIEKMAGDTVLMDYINGGIDTDELKEYIKIEEQKWIRKAKKYLLYEDSLWRIK